MTDPTGMSAVFGDFYNKNGEKIGTDGIDDGKKYIVTNDLQARTIRDTNTAGGTTQVGAVSSAVSLPSDSSLQESLNVLDRTINNGGLREESSIVMDNGNTIRGAIGELPTIVDGIQTARASLPNLPIECTVADVETTIHSHPTRVQESNGMVFPQSASTRSSQDEATFSQYGTNIIVGPLGTINNVTRGPDGRVKIPPRSNGAVIYRSGQQPVELKRSVIERILR